MTTFAWALAGFVAYNLWVRKSVDFENLATHSIYEPELLTDGRTKHIYVRIEVLRDIASYTHR